MKAPEFQDTGDPELYRKYILWLMLAHTRDAVLQVRKKELKKYRITPQQAGILNRIDQLGDKATAAEVGRWSFRKPNTMTPILRRMVSKGWIQKSDKGSKNVLIKLTPEGKKVLNKSKKWESVGKAFSNLNDSELEQFGSTLEKIMGTTCKMLKVKFATNYYPISKEPEF